MKLQLDARRQLRTSTFSQMKRGLSDFGQIASSSESMSQSSTSTFFASMSMPSLFQLVSERMVTRRATTSSHSLK